MGASAFFLRSTFSRIQLSGACIIMIGALVVLSPDLTGHQGSTESHGYANFLYWASNVPMALSAVYKEYKFADGNVHVWDGAKKKRICSLRRYPTSVACLAFSPSGERMAVAASYTWELGEQAHAADAIFVRTVSDSEVKPKASKAKA